MNTLEILKQNLEKYERLAIAYSGGCDSNFLLQIAIDTLGKENVLAIVCIGDMMSREDIQHVRILLKDVQHVEIPVDVFAVDAFKSNDKKRCYYCKKTIMSTILKEARKQGYQHVADGKNLDDEGVYRPGNMACQELGIISPLFDSKLTKSDIRKYSKELNIVTHDKPANACLASRFNYDTVLTKEKLQMVDQAEEVLHQLGIYHVRVRVQDTLARIEVEKQHFNQIIKDPSIVDKIKAVGFSYVTLDLHGITSGGYDK